MVTAADIAVPFMAANSAAKRISGGKIRVLPAEGGGGESHWGESGEVKPHSMGVENEVPRLSLEGVESGFPNRLSYCRSRKPVLETINEEPIWSR